MFKFTEKQRADMIANCPKWGSIVQITDDKFQVISGYMKCGASMGEIVESYQEGHDWLNLAKQHEDDDDLTGWDANPGFDRWRQKYGVPTVG